jgi:Tfp pilus assembly protein FimT
MRTRTRGARGYSLAELMTVVGMVGIVSLIGIPALMQLMPQYRIKSAASEMAASIRMIRERAISTRTSWKMVVDPSNDRFTMWEMINGSWVQTGNDGRKLTGTLAYKSWTGVDIQAAASPTTVAFDRSGAQTTSSDVVVTLAVDSTLVRYNRYTITVSPSGNITVVPSKV